MSVINVPNLNIQRKSKYFTLLKSNDQPTVDKIYLCAIRPVLQADWYLTPSQLTRRSDPGFRNQMPEVTSPHLLLGAQDQRLVAEQDQLPRGPKGTSSGD